MRFYSIRRHAARFGLVLALLSASHARAATIFVNAAAAPGGNGASWATAHNDLRTALIASAGGDEVWVARGTYRPNTLLDRGLRFSVPSGVKVFGGFAGNESSIEARPVDPNPEAADPAHDTIISGEIGAPGLADNTVTVVDLSFPSPATRLDRLVVTEGANEGGRGGGMRIGDGSPTISDCLFINNTAAEGGALWILRSSAAVIERCVFKSNSASSAGAIAIQTATPTVRSTRFESNSSANAGGAVQNSFGAGGAYEGCDFINCTTGGIGGGAIYTVWQPTASSLHLTDCTFTTCRSAEAPIGSSGGALFTNGAGTMTVTRCVFDGCRGYGGAAVNHQGAHNPVYTDCEFRNGTGSFGGAAHTFIPATFTNCLFENNTAASAGGAAQTNSASIFAGCEFRMNRVTGGTNNGGALYLWGNSTITGCLFEANTTNAGGALYMASGTHTVDRCRFVGNSATSGACLFATSNSSATIENSLMVGNSTGFFGSVATINASSGGGFGFNNCTMAGNSGSQGAVNAFTGVTLTNCILRNPGPELGGLATATYSNIEGGALGAGNINADPLFTNPALGDYSLLPGSPCIDAGNNTALISNAMDLALNDRMIDDGSMPDTGVGPAPVVDMGAFEFQAPPPPECPGDANGDEVVDFADITSVLASFNLTGPSGDANHDGSVNFADITSVLSNFGLPCL